MSSKSKTSRKLRIDRPFDAKIAERARLIARSYKILIWFADGEYYGRGLEIPGAMGDGKTPDACIQNVREALVAVVATLLENGESPPPPASEERRTEQVNVRLSAEEKLALETAAQSKGYKGLSDFVRAAALTAAK